MNSWPLTWWSFADTNADDVDDAADAADADADTDDDAVVADAAAAADAACSCAGVWGRPLRSFICDCLITEYPVHDGGGPLNRSFIRPT